jgi:hypothetical protein
VLVLARVLATARVLVLVLVTARVLAALPGRCIAAEGHPWPLQGSTPQHPLKYSPLELPHTYHWYGCLHSVSAIFSNCRSIESQRTAKGQYAVAARAVG